MKIGFVGDPSSEEFCNAYTFCMELSSSRAIVTEPVNVAVTPGLVFRRCLWILAQKPADMAEVSHSFSHLL